ncbi:MAG: aspartate-semialdehyde dehydrogenase [Rickettsiaceae bacterium]|nr:aspartate-semialdehyde dehydrogenase [Rickettsiaceae bacterium]
MIKKYNVAVIGATGNVGREVLNILAEKKFPIDTITAFASPGSVGRLVSFGDKEVRVEMLDKKSDFSKINIAFFCAGSTIAKEYAQKAADSGCIVIDKSSFFRLKDDVPLIVPEANIDKLKKLADSKIIANPNCCVIPLAVALKPLDNAAKIKRLVISTYQSVSGAGKEAMDELYEQTKSKFVFGETKKNVFQDQIAFNLFPKIGEFLPSGESDEEYKIKEELKKIIGNHINVSVTCVRVPVFVSHAMSVNIEFEKPLDAIEAQEILREEESIALYTTENGYQYATPIDVVEREEVFVSRIRNDASAPNSLNMWVCCDNLRKGAALNAVQIAEALLIQL